MEDRAVGPVIGVILMVAITVILVAAIGMLVFGLRDQVSETSSRASFGFDYDGTDNLMITHEGGEQIAANQVMITGSSSSSGNNWTSYGDSDPITAGRSAVVNNSGEFIDDDTVHAVWNLQSGSTSSTLQQWTYNGQMNSRHLLAEDDVMPPVTDVVLMVAITVVLTVIIGAFVLGFGDQIGNTTPQASFGFGYNDTALMVTHGSGISIDAVQVSIISSVALNGSAGQPAGANGTTETWESITSDLEIAAGNRATVAEQSVDDPPVATIRVIWISESSSNSVVLQNWSGSDA